MKKYVIKLCLPSGRSIDRIRDHRGHVHHGSTIQSTLSGHHKTWFWLSSLDMLIWLSESSLDILIDRLVRLVTNKTIVLVSYRQQDPKPCSLPATVTYPKLTITTRHHATPVWCGTEMWCHNKTLTIMRLQKDSTCHHQNVGSHPNTVRLFKTGGSGTGLGQIRKMNSWSWEKSVSFPMNLQE